MLENRTQSHSSWVFILFVE